MMGMRLVRAAAVEGADRQYNDDGAAVEGPITIPVGGEVATKVQKEALSQENSPVRSRSGSITEMPPTTDVAVENAEQSL